MPPSGPLHAATPGCVVVVGMHRSGTSLAAGLLARMGVGMGERLVPADSRNPRGYFEDVDVVRFHQTAFRACLADAEAGHPDWGWTPQVTVQAEELAKWKPEARLLVERRAASGRPWGFKDPRATVVLDFWDPLLSAPVYVGMYRDPSRVADSMQRLGASVFLENQGYAWSIWTFYNRRLLDFVRRHRDRCILVNVDALGGSLDVLPGLLRERLRLPVDDADLLGHYAPDLLRGEKQAGRPPAIWRRVWEESAALLDELDSIADLPAPRESSGGGPTQPCAFPQRTRASEVSIVIPTHDDAVSLVEALASAEACTAGQHEILVLDDGTTDPESLWILDRLRAAGRPVLRQPNAGLAAARNALIEAASGRYILPLDADNRLCPGFIERALAAFHDDPRLGVVYGDRTLFGAQAGRLHVPDFDLRSMVNRNEIDACAMFSRDLWNDVGGYDAELRGFEDWEFWLHAGKRGWKFLHLPEVALEYRVRPNSLLAQCHTPAGYRTFRRRLWQRHADLLMELTPAAVRTLAGVGSPFPRDIGVLRGWQRLVLRGHWHLVWSRTASPDAVVPNDPRCEA